MSQLIKIDTDQAPRAIGPYSQALCSHPFVFVSGQLPINPLTGKIVEKEIKVQVSQVLDNLEAILKEACCSLKDVVRCDVFLIDLNDFAAVNEIYATRFAQTVAPARQTIQAARLPLDALVEISCIAVMSN